MNDLKKEMQEEEKREKANDSATHDVEDDDSQEQLTSATSFLFSALKVEELQ